MSQRASRDPPVPRRGGSPLRWERHRGHLDRFEVDAAEAHYRQALALADPRGMRPLIAHCQLGLDKLYVRTGKRDEAREHLTTAATMYREMDMRFWLEQAEAALRRP